ncbi:MAG: enolase C-terminal domain-like protein, partial [Mycobacteriales bacterium]
PEQSPQQGIPEVRPPWPHRDNLQISAVRPIVTAPEGIPLVVVLVETSEPGLTGLGCATFTQRWRAVAGAVEHLVPLAVGRHPGDIEDITRLVRFSSYWRGGPVLENALSGLDMALWDIAGKRAGLPVHDLVGGRMRAGVPLYAHAAAGTIEETIEKAQALVAAGYRYVRLQAGQPGIGSYGAPGSAGGYPRSPHPDGWDVRRYLAQTPHLFARAREVLGDDIELLHDVHNRLTPKEAIVLCRALEPYRLYFVEDVVAPEYFARLPEIRAASPVPIAVGELLTSPTQAADLILAGGIDLLRAHISAIGGFTPARKLSALCEFTGVRTAWHGPADVSPVGVAANVTLDVTTPAFGVQESHDYPEKVHAVFPGTPSIENGHIVPSTEAGWGVSIDLTEAGKYPPDDQPRHDRWSAQVRRPDGGIEAP